MTRPTFNQWRTQSSPIPGLTGSTLSNGPQTVKERLLAALASFTIRTNPDGTGF